MRLRTRTAHAAELGAGTLVFVGRFDLAEFAVVLEPEEPLRTARRALYAGMSALADALADACAAREADRVRLAGRHSRRWRAGRRRTARLAAGATKTSRRLARVRRHDPHRIDGDGGPGVRPLAAALEEEGFDDLGSGRLVESFARHLMVALDAWQEKGFEEVAKGYLSRLPPGAGHAPRHRRQRRPAAPAPGQDRRRASRACCQRSRCRRGSTRRPGVRGEAAAHHPARSIGHIRVRARGGAGRMGGVGYFRVLRRRSGSARGQGARRLPRRLPWCRFVRLVDAGADRRGERRRSQQRDR